MKKDILSGFIAGLITFVLGLCFFKLPAWHNQILAHYVHRSVHLIHPLTDAESGATAFQIQTPRGTKYTITAGHVCTRPLPFYVLEVSKERKLPVIVLAKSAKLDICVLTPLPNSVPLALRDAEKSAVWVAGFPGLEIFRIQAGYLLGQEMVTYPYRDTDKADYKMGEREFYVLNLAVEPGNSGSPILDEWGRVLGLLNAKKGGTAFGTSTKVLLKFLEEMESKASAK